MAEKKYTLKATNTECRFDTADLDLSAGTHTFVVKAKADGYKDSPYSNEVVVNVAATGFTFTILKDNYNYGNLYINEILQDSRTGTWWNVCTVRLDGQGDHIGMLLVEGDWSSNWALNTDDNVLITLTEDVVIAELNK